MARHCKPYAQWPGTVRRMHSGQALYAVCTAVRILMFYFVTLQMEEDAGGCSAPPPEEGYLLVRIHVPELNVQKCLQFPRDQLVWDVKQQCLAALPKVKNGLVSCCVAQGPAHRRTSGLQPPRPIQSHFYGGTAVFLLPDSTPHPTSDFTAVGYRLVRLFL